VRIPTEAAGALLNQNAVKLTPAEHVDQQYLFYLLRSENFKTYIIGTAQGAASQAAITLDAIRGYEFALPPLPVQRRIAGILSAYDELIENSQRRIRILESMARALYREWFVNKDLPISLNGAAVAEGQLADLCDLTKERFTDEQHTELPLLDLSRMTQRSLAPSATGVPSELKTSRIVFEPGDTLFGSIRCYLHKVNLAHFQGVTNTSVLVLRPRTPELQSLVAILVSDTETIRWADTHSSGTKMPVIKWDVLQAMPAPTPSAEVAREFDAIAGPMLDNIGILAKRIQNLRRTRDLLLPRLVSGQLELEAA